MRAACSRLSALNRQEQHELSDRWGTRGPQAVVLRITPGCRRTFSVPLTAQLPKSRTSSCSSRLRSSRSVNWGEGINGGQKERAVPEMLIDVDLLITGRATLIQLNDGLHRYLLMRCQAGSRCLVPGPGGRLCGCAPGPGLGGLWEEGEEGRPQCVSQGPYGLRSQLRVGPRPLGVSPAGREGAQTGGTFSQPLKPQAPSSSMDSVCEANVRAVAFLPASGVLSSLENFTN